MAAPTFVPPAGTGATDAGGVWSYNTSSNGIDLIVIFQVLQDGSTGGAVALTSVANVASLDGTASSMDYIGAFTVGASNEAIQHLWIGRNTSGASGPSLSGTNSTSEDLYMRLYWFADVSTGTTLATVIENGTAGATTNVTGTSATASAPTVTTLGPDRLALAFLAINDDNALGGLFTGETGGNWSDADQYIEASGTDGAISEHRAAMPTSGTISGGTVSITDSDAWGVVGFALIGITAGSTTVEGFGQAQAQILAFGVKGYGQAQTDVKQTYNQFAQAQSRIKQTYNGFAQAQATILGWGFAQSQADIKQTYGGYAQAQALLAIVSRGFAQAQARIIYKGNSSAQTQAVISTPYGLPFLDTFNRSVSDGLGTSDNGDTWVRISGTTANIDVNGSALVALLTSTALDYQLKQTFINAYSGIETSGRFSFSALPGGSPHSVIIYPVRDGSSAFSQVSITLDSSGQLAFGVDVVITTSYQINDIYNFKVHKLADSGPNYNFSRFKAWKVGDPEPGWTDSDVSAWLPVDFQTYPGISLTGSNSATVTIDYIQIIQAWPTQYGQAQAVIKATVNKFAQAQACIKGNGFAQAQAMIYIPQYLRPVSDITTNDWVGVIV